MISQNGFSNGLIRKPPERIYIYSLPVFCRCNKSANRF